MRARRSGRENRPSWRLAIAIPLLDQHAPRQNIEIQEVIGPGVEFPNLGVAGSSPAGRANAMSQCSEPRRNLPDRIFGLDRYDAFQLAEAAVPRAPFRKISPTTAQFARYRHGNRALGKYRFYSLISK